MSNYLQMENQEGNVCDADWRADTGSRTFVIRGCTWEGAMALRRDARHKNGWRCRELRLSCMAVADVNDCACSCGRRQQRNWHCGAENNRQHEESDRGNCDEVPCEDRRQCRPQ